MSGTRQMEVLHAIVEDYVHTREPVGSKMIAAKYPLGVSSATIRNDMAILEEEGLIAAPHTSAGRVPTDKGYRAFVDQISGIKPLSSAQRRAITQFLDESENVEDLLARTVKMLAGLTDQVALIQYPINTAHALLHIELIALVPGKVRMIVIADNGRVDQSVLSYAGELNEEQLAAIGDALRQGLSEHSVEELVAQSTQLQHNIAEQHRAGRISSAQLSLADAALEQIRELISAQRSDKILLAGTANLVRAGDFPMNISGILEALEEQVVILELLSNMQVIKGQLGVSIGAENEQGVFSETALVAGTYDDVGIAKIGVLGPTRMDYANSMSAVGALAQYVSKYVSGPS